jgi:superfamily I DNA/RNA helicase
LILSTIHSAKGRVGNLVLNRRGRLHPFHPAPAPLAKRGKSDILYVAMTRAKDNLTLSSAALLHSQAKRAG